MKHAISWFEIPSKDLERATKFYEDIFQLKMIPMDTPNLRMRMFPIEDMMNVGGAVVHSNGFHIPSSTDGPFIYLNGNPDVQNILDRVEKAGGKVLVQKTEISPEYGYIGVFLDTEGNRVGLHSVAAAI
jgi:predicted enzyme related to lactoylglutathione lyase